MKYKDYYQILGVERTASDAEIKKAYRKRAHKYHPDISKDAEGEAKFKEVAEAYAALKDPEKRAEYDSLGTRRSGEEFAPPPQWEQQFGSERGFSFEDLDLADILAAFGHSGHGRSRHGRHAEQFSMPGQDFEVKAPVTLEQLHAGGEIELRVELPEPDARGIVHHVPHTFRINIPKGAADAQRLRLPAKGGQGINGGPAGDLYVALALQPHRLYRVDGRNLYMDLPLAPWEAVLGAKVEIPTLGGTVELNVHPGTAAGRKLRLARRGLPTADGGAGDLFAVVRIDIPPVTSAHERELFEQLAAASTFNPRKHLAEGGR